MKKFCFTASFRKNGRNIFTYRVYAVDIVSAMYALRRDLSDSFISCYMTSLKFDDIYE